MLKYLSRASGQNQRYGVCPGVSWAAWALCLDAWVRGKEKEEAEKKNVAIQRKKESERGNREMGEKSGGAVERKEEKRGISVNL